MAPPAHAMGRASFPELYDRGGLSGYFLALAFAAFFSGQ